MGILRTILAIAVVVYHSFKIFGLRMCGGQVAVESFYMISGFYMALILNEKYIGLKNYKKFISSRLFRIFPAYWFVLAFALLASFIGYCFFNNPIYLRKYIEHYSCLNAITLLYFIIENIIIIGQDVLYFLKINSNCNPEFTYDVLSYAHTGYQYLFVPQAWSISLELIFYSIAPFIVTKKIKWQFLLVFLGLLGRIIYSQILYLDFDPWTYRFFPLELVFFVAGSLAYRLYKVFEIKKKFQNAGYYILLPLVLIIIFYNEISFEENIKLWAFYCIVFISIPFIFLTFKNNSTDRYIGELSFSIYISHHVIVGILRNYFLSKPVLCPYYGYSVLVCSLLIAIIMQQFIIKPIEIKRKEKFSPLV